MRPFQTSQHISNSPFSCFSNTVQASFLPKPSKNMTDLGPLSREFFHSKHSHKILLFVHYVFPPTQLLRAICGLNGLKVIREPAALPIPAPATLQSLQPNILVCSGTAFSEFSLTMRAASLFSLFAAASFAVAHPMRKSLSSFRPMVPITPQLSLCL